MRVSRFEHQFVKFIPEKLAEGVLYVSMENAVAVHNCGCGCGKEVVTPFSPTDWQLRFDGVSISLQPSIGNWSFPCRSHYFIRDGAVRWAANMSLEEIQYGRNKDRLAKQLYYGLDSDSKFKRIEIKNEKSKPEEEVIIYSDSLWRKFKKLLQ